MKVVLSWIQEFVDIAESAENIGALLSLRGLALEGIEGDGDEAVLDFDVTANRPDCLSVLGIAREIATAYRLPLRGGALDTAEVTPPDGVPFPVTIADPDLCGRYAAAIADVQIAPAPTWMQQRLTACGVRPINNVVDVTNYVLIERGYPMHAFDHARLQGAAIIVRRAQPGERLRTLDTKDRSLTPDTLVIADAERAQAIGGVMGGAESEVSAQTRRIVLEAAWFAPSSVRATSKRLALRTEASYRFERGVDPTATVSAMRRALTLIEQIGAGRGVGAITDCRVQTSEPRHVELDTDAIARVLGMDVPQDEAERILQSLGFSIDTMVVSSRTGAPTRHWRVSVPGWRVDVSRAVDLIEEVGRHHGFEHLPSTFPAIEQPPGPSDARIARDDRVRRVLVASGVSEAVTFAFIAPGLAVPFLGSRTPVTLANPLAETLATMRPSLLPGLLAAASHNRRHGVSDVRLFEIGTRFSPEGESRAIAAVWTGRADVEHWSGGARAVDLFDVKGVAEQLAALASGALVCVPAEYPFLVSGHAAALATHGRAIGVIGQIAPDILAAHELPLGDEVYALEVDLGELFAHNPTVRKATPLPRHPSVQRDIALLIDDALSAETVRDTIRAAAPTTLTAIREFDRYQGKGIPQGKVSLALHLVFQAPDRTLTEGEVHAAVEQIVGVLRERVGAERR